MVVSLKRIIFMLLGLVLSAQVQAQVQAQAQTQPQAPVQAKTQPQEQVPEPAQIQTRTNSIDSQRIEKIIQQKLPNTPVGIFLQDAKTGKILYERRAFETFLPASTVKVISTATSLFLLGPQYQYETSFKVASNDKVETGGKAAKAAIDDNSDNNSLREKKNIQSGILKGNLYLEFSGDPSFKTEDLQKLVQDLKASGIKQIQGNLVIDDSLFKGKVHPYGWMADDLTWYFAARVSSVILDENKVKLLVKSNKTLGEKATVVLAPENTLPIKISQAVVSVTETEAEENCELDVLMDNDNNINIKGCWPSKEKEDELKVAVQNPNLVAMQILKKALKANNITLTGKIVFGLTPKKASVLVSHRSPPLEVLIKTILQDSNNLYAESLLKTMGVQKFQQGTFQAGLRAMKAVLNKDFAIDTTTIRLLDASGGSRYNAITPEVLGRVLYVMYHNPNFGQLFQDSLPNSGKSGTLEKRMASFDLNTVIHAKTGTMTGVSALAGYISNQKKEDLIFVIMINGAVGESASSKQLENELCKIFVQS